MLSGMGILRQFLFDLGYLLYYKYEVGGGPNTDIAAAGQIAD